MVGGLRREPRDRRSILSRRYFSRLRSGTSCKSDITQAQYFILTSQKNQIARSASEPRSQGPLAEDALAKLYLGADIFGDLMKADHKVLNDEGESRNNHRYVVVDQDLATQWIQSYPCKTKTSQETEKEFTKVS